LHISISDNPRLADDDPQHVTPLRDSTTAGSGAFQDRSSPAGDPGAVHGGGLQRRTERFMMRSTLADRIHRRAGAVPVSSALGCSWPARQHSVTIVTDAGRGRPRTQPRLACSMAQAQNRRVRRRVAFLAPQSARRLGLRTDVPGDVNDAVAAAKW
jgi:hypothetical protein